jgi:hypothetical protein
MTMADIERTFAAETISITSQTSEGPVRFVARILRRGDRYGLNDVLVWDVDPPGVEFYDTRYPHTEFGQFVSRYYVRTLLEEHGPRGLDLMGYVPSWKIDGSAMVIVRQWLHHEVTS